MKRAGTAEKDSSDAADWMTNTEKESLLPIPATFNRPDSYREGLPIWHGRHTSRIVQKTSKPVPLCGGGVR